MYHHDDQDENDIIMVTTATHHSFCHHGNHDHEDGDHGNEVSHSRHIPSISDLSLNYYGGQQIGFSDEEDTRKLARNHNCRTTINHSNHSNFNTVSIPLKRSSMKNSIKVIHLPQMQWTRGVSMMIILVFMSTMSFLLPSCSSFNLEPRLPIIKRGQDNSYFGYSVAQHIIQDETRGRIIDTV